MLRKFIVFTALLISLSLSGALAEPQSQQSSSSSSSNSQGRFFDLATLLGVNRYPRPYPGQGYYPGGGSGYYPGGGSGYYPGGGYPGGGYPGGYGTNFIGGGGGYGDDIPSVGDRGNRTFIFPNRPQPATPPFNPPPLTTLSPDWVDSTLDVNGVETFYEIGTPLEPREKRDTVVFPVEDELLPINATSAFDDDGGASIEVQEAAAVDDVGRTARQVLQTVTKIDVGPQSQLFVAPGSTSVVYFEVTNLRNEPTYHNFNVQDEKRFLRQMEPRFLWLMPNQRESVRVTILVPQGSELGSKDKITFTSQSVVQTQQSVMVTVSSNGVADSWQPHLWYTYNTRCDWRWNCVGGSWSIEVVARDYETGILSIRSNPEGLVLRAPFTAGTNDEVKATFSASCCEPRVTITAYDLNRNQRTLQLNVDDPWLSEYGIATVVLACLFLLLLIVLIVICVRWCIKRRRASRDLPTYRPGDRFSEPRT